MNRRIERRLPLGLRLTRTAIGAAAIALLIAGSVLNGVMFQLAKRALLADSVSLAGVIAGNLSAPLLFGDRQAAHETLDTLQASPQVVAATLRDVGGHVFADYRRDGVTGTPPGAATSDGHAFEGRALRVWQPVSQHGEALGRVEFAVSLDPLYRQAALFGAITLAAALVALGIAYLLALGVRRDINRVERRLDQLAYLDPVTGLLNRHAAGEHLRAAVSRARGDGGGFALMLIDLDDFKVINDTLGHAVGDAVLHALAQRLNGLLPPGAAAYRFGGDEFVVVVDGAREFSGRALQHALAAPLQVDTHEIYLRCSAGIAAFPGDAGDEQELLRAADAAMYHAKALGKNGFAEFRPEMRGATQHRLRIEAELRHALRHGELRLHYQPIVDLESGEVVGAEALLRWQHPERGLVPPAEFIAVAEASGLIVDIGGWVLVEVAAQLARWADAGLDRFFVAVNASARQLRGGELLRQVDRALADARCPAHRLEIEITEHTLVEDAEDNVQTLQALRARGVRIAIDDFGTGLSSLAYLKRLPVDKFKIDRSFVRELPAARGDLAIVRAVISMARALDLRVTAEGVETAAQRDVLLRLGCDLAQGYHFGRALAPGEFGAMLLELRRLLTVPGE